ncbi:MAG: hypothetical protein FWC28_06620 [Proteobacteria bacterium]|nr:hypothetical protein [Pseudomonadota bacterium]
MAVDPTELRLPNALATFDAAIHLGMRDAKLWSITLLPSAALLAASIFLLDAIRLNSNMGWASALLCLAWCFRACGQGAATHYINSVLFEQNHAGFLACWKAALARLPSLVFAAGLCFWMNVFILCFSGGLLFFWLNAHFVAYGVAQQGHGKTWSLYFTCSRALAPLQHQTVWLNLFGLSGLLIVLGLVQSTTWGLELLNQLIGLNTNFFLRLTSSQNPSWYFIVAVVAFGLFEPIRACLTSLLLANARTRREGLDLSVAIERLPHRNKLVGTSLVLVCLLPTLAYAKTPSALETLKRNCPQEFQPASNLIEQAHQISPQATEHWLDSLNNKNDCETVQKELELAAQPLKQLIHHSKILESSQPTKTAERILSQDEFQQAQPKSKKTAQPKDTNSWWEGLFKWLKKIIENSSPEENTHYEPRISPFKNFSLGGWTLLGLVAGLAILGITLFFAFLSPHKKKTAKPQETNPSITNELAQALTKPVSHWTSHAEKLCEKGQFREAIRSLYLGVLVQTHNNGQLDFEPTLSNFENLKRFRGPQTIRQDFKQVIIGFEFSWYGYRTVDASMFVEYKKLCQRILRVES